MFPVPPNIVFSVLLFSKFGLFPCNCYFSPVPQNSEELRQRQVEHQLLQLKIARNLKEAAEMAKMDSSSDSDEDD